ncbi:MAG: hypothetical protein AAB601_01555, partial [Patescibacteria group bacterium]
MNRTVFQWSLFILIVASALFGGAVFRWGTYSDEELSDYFRPSLPRHTQLAQVVPPLDTGLAG